MSPETERQLTDYFASRADVVFALLFGSAATGRSTRESDVDLAVYLCDPGPAGDPTPPAARAAEHPASESPSSAPTPDRRRVPPAAATPDGADPTATNVSPASSSSGRPTGRRRPVLPDVEEPDRRFSGEDEIWADVERICATQVDLVVLNRAPATIAAGAMLTGRLLHTADEALSTRFFLVVTTLAEDERDFTDDFVRTKERSRSLSPIDRTRLVRIVDFLEDELTDAPRFAEMDLERYATDRDFRRSVERWVENLVNASIDAAKIVLASERRPVPQTYRETLRMLATVDGFRDGPQIAHRLAANTRIRNMLAHEYLDLRYTQVNEVVDHADETYGELVASLRRWMR